MKNITLNLEQFFIRNKLKLHMNIQNRAQSFKMQPKTVTIARNSQPGNQVNYMSLKERPLLDNHRNYYQNNDAPIMSAKIRVQRPQQYLIRSVPTQKQYESQIEKLNQICQQFFLQNEKLKRKVNNQNFECEQILKKKVVYLENQLKKNRQILDYKNNLIEQMTMKVKKIEKKQDNFFSQGYPYSKSNLTIYKECESSMSKQLFEQIQQRENQLMKYMHKQSQFVQIYVQKEQLEQQVRRYEVMITMLTKQIEQLKRKLEYFANSQSSILRTEQSDRTIQKIKQYNQKLLKMLQVSSCEIQRLNNILKVKIQQNENKSLLLQSQKKEIQQMKQILAEHTKAKDLETSINFNSSRSINQKISNIQKQAKINFQRQMSEKILFLSQQNSNLRKRLSEQVIINQEFRILVQKFSSKEEQNSRSTLKLQVEVQTEKQIDPSEVNASDFDVQEVDRNGKKSSNKIETDEKLNNLKRQNQLVKSLQQKVKNLNLQRQQSFRLIRGQNIQIVNIKKELRVLEEANKELKMHIGKMEQKEKQLGNIFSQISTLESKLILATQEYDSLLNEVHSSCGKTENIHRQLQLMIQQKYSMIEDGGQDYEKRLKNQCRSQTYDVKRQKDTQLNLRQNEFDKVFSAEETSIRIKKRQIKSNSQSQLLHNI